MTKEHRLHHHQPHALTIRTIKNLDKVKPSGHSPTSRPRT
ncbi:hypothetical protein BIFGAL_03706 [Bifidobacterium gallicum DSM 20093 = LMG 11596]|uniref:Uncharacterized protein n=1 Tax=Bifidobacterium gallicum DSM 20093 = LMG 11596 TaxID=561180 RepID=D1NV25_9BIFI|nr:hypothetical protein BIFGAL_03706 [Bifidobacterium gallicum DSM 20093 = LMG 11596]